MSAGVRLEFYRLFEVSNRSDTGPDVLELRAHFDALISASSETPLLVDAINKMVAFLKPITLVPLGLGSCTTLMSLAYADEKHSFARAVFDFVRETKAMVSVSDGPATPEAHQAVMRRVLLLNARHLETGFKTVQQEAAESKSHDDHVRHLKYAAKYSPGESIRADYSGRGAGYRSGNNPVSARFDELTARKAAREARELEAAVSDQKLLLLEGGAQFASTACLPTSYPFVNTTERKCQRRSLISSSPNLLEYVAALKVGLAMLMNWHLHLPASTPARVVSVSDVKYLMLHFIQVNKSRIVDSVAGPEMKRLSASLLGNEALLLKIYAELIDPESGLNKNLGLPVNFLPAEEASSEFTAAIDEKYPLAAGPAGDSTVPFSASYGQGSGGSGSASLGAGAPAVQSSSGEGGAPAPGAGD